MKAEPIREYWTIVHLRLHPDYKEGDTQDIVERRPEGNFIFMLTPKSFGCVTEEEHSLINKGFTTR